MSSEIDEMNENHIEPHPLSDLDQESSRHQSVKSSDDIPQLEYDECDIQLIADREIDDDDLDYDVMMGSTINPGVAISNITSDGIIDDDFETELAGSQNTDIHESDDPDHHLIEKISEYGIVEVYDDDKFGRKMIVFSACRLPHQTLIQNSEFKTVHNFYNCLLKYIFRTFNRYVDNDYVIIYFHRGLHSYNRPSYGWLLDAYRRLERKYKKNLKALYIVHPTTWIKFLWPILRSFISAKFSSKLIYINRLGQLTEYVHMENLKIPVEVKNYDPIIPIEIPPIELRPTIKFHVPLQFILDHEPGEKVPLIVQQTVDFIKNYGLNEPGILCRSAPVKLIKFVQKKYNAGEPVVFAQYNDLHLAGCILKIFLRDLTEPLLTFRLYPELISLASGLKRSEQLDAVRDLINTKLPVESYNVLKYLLEFFNLISIYSDTNFMTTVNLALIFGLNLARSDDLKVNTMENLSLINMLIEYLIIHYAEIFLH